MQQRFTASVLAFAIAGFLTACSGASIAQASVTDCEDLASSAAQAHGDRVFVEAGGTTYTVDSVRTLPDNRVIVATTVDRPDLVGYPQVRFISACDGDQLTLLGGYVPVDGNFELLFTTNEGSEVGNVPFIEP